ncbi:MAG: tetraacyldisaccharide 4'-kinase [Candidatus Pelagibacterales bacterium]|nr:MAG: tetraacyldisaccharide 4'-kinase [Pelagibacterales bacterium]
MNFFKPKFWDRNKISISSILLFPISLLIKLLSLFKRTLTKTNSSSIPTICVGNIYLGGTGKTPLCIEIFSILKDLNMNPAFIRKKYASQQDEVNLQKKIGMVFQNKKRTKATEEAAKNNFNIAILDDGFQDYSIEKNLSLVCFNEKQWIGNGLTIPAGPLRETLNALKRADCVIINGEKNKDIEDKILNKNEKIKIFYTKYKPKNIDKLKNEKIVAFAGIGNPENFFNLLRNNKLNIIETIKFPDHYKYSKKEIENLMEKTKKDNCILLTTEKDYFRISEDNKKNINYLEVSVDIENKNQFIEIIKKII